jgi:hypothetical protein
MCACAAVKPKPTIQARDTVWVDYTCRLENGLIAATTLESIAENDRDNRARIFKEHRDYVPLHVVAGSECEPCRSNGKLPEMDKEIELQMTAFVVGKTEGLYPSVQLISEVPEGLHPETRFLRAARIQPREKESRMSRQRYVEQFGADPRIGEEWPQGPGFKLKLARIQGDTVIFRLIPDPSHEFDTPFGRATIVDKGNLYEVIIDAQEGRLVRMGNTVGRIVEVDESVFTVDFGHPFGGAILNCDIDIVSVDHAAH